MTTLTGRKVETTRAARVPGIADLAYEAIDESNARNHSRIDYIWGLLRLGMGWTFLWAFIDKVFGLGFATEAGKGWIDGVSPTEGFLNFATRGPLVDFYHGIAGNAAIDWLFMLGILAIGLPLMLGIGVRVAASIGVPLLLLMYSALLLPEHNPVVDDHIVYAVILAGLAIANPRHELGPGRWWRRTKLVGRLPILA